MAYYGLFVTLTILAVFLLSWGFNILLDGRIDSLIKLIKPAALVSVLMSFTFMLFMLLAVMKNKEAIKQDAFTARRENRKPRNNNPPIKVTPAPKLSSELAPVVDVSATATTIPISLPAIDFTVTTVHKTLKDNKFLESPAKKINKKGIVIKVSTFDRRFGSMKVTVETVVSSDLLQRMTFHLSKDNKGNIEPEADAFLRKFFSMHMKSSMKDIDGILHAPDWGKPLVRQSNDLFLVKAKAIKTMPGESRFLIIHKDDPTKNSSTDDLATKQAGADWDANCQWNDVTVVDK